MLLVVVVVRATQAAAAVAVVFLEASELKLVEARVAGEEN
jgi:hypothetical protein